MRTHRLAPYICLVFAIVEVAVLSPVWASAQEGMKARDQVGSFNILFQGNKALSETALRKAAAEELAAFEKQGRHRSDIDDAAFQMELAYRKAGYAFATVNYSMKDVGGKSVVIFSIKEGPLVILEKILITGNATFDRQTLLNFFEGKKPGLFGHGEAPLVKSEVDSALSRIRDFYISNGYLHVVVGDPHFTFNRDRTRATVAINIEEGIRYVVHGVFLEGDVVEGSESVLKKLRGELVGKPYFSRRKIALQNRLADLYGDLGYPKASVEVKERQGEAPGRVVLVADIRKGPLVTISNIVIQGNERTRDKFIRSRVLLKPGDLFDLKKQKESFRQLYGTGLFSRVDLGLQERKGSNTWPLIVKVREVPAKEVYFESGWGSYERLRMKTGFRDKNLFGTGRVLDLNGTGSFKARSIGASILDPWFLNTSITASLPVGYSRREEPSFTREDKEASVQFSKGFSDSLSVTAQYVFRVTDLTNVGVVETGTQDNYNLTSVKFQSTYDTRDDPFFPSRGQRCFVSTEHAGTFLGGEISFFRFTGGARFFFPLAGHTILALRYSTGLIIPGSNDITVPIGERFFNGGENTVRSFRQSELGPRNESGDPAGGLAFNVFNIELRQRLKGNLVGTVFLDLGNISPNRTRFELGLPPYESRSEILSDTFSQYFKGIRPAVGLGLQYLLPVGPVRADLAFNPDRNAERGEDLFVFHFSVGMAF